MTTYQNPIIPGFYPDPSICRVGEDYYLVNSSFEFYPGTPLWHSKDLVHWEQIGNILNRDSQLLLENCSTSGGIYACTIRCHEGRFYMVTTNVSNGGNFYVWTDDMNGDWSDPIYVNQGGIDPSLFWDDDGTAYFLSNASGPDGRPTISQCIINLENGEKLTPTRSIWNGTGGKCPEGPHMYKINGLYYLMIAEGGTEYGHMQTIARSSSVWGPFEACPHNPILSHRDVSPRESEFQALGHSDLVQDPQGQWWIVFHAIRPSQFMLHHIGRETMLAPVTWDDDGWPVVNVGAPIANPMEVPGDLGDCRVSCSAREEFDGDALGLAWCFLRNPDRSRYSLTKKKGFLTIEGMGLGLDDIGSPSFLGRRQPQFNLRAEALMELPALAENAAAGITVFHTNQHHYDIVVTKRNGKRIAVLRKRVADILVESEPVVLPDSGALLLRIDAQRLLYTFQIGTEERNLQTLGTGTSQLLSTECTNCTFTGCFLGMFAEGSAVAAFDYFEITETDAE